MCKCIHKDCQFQSFFKQEKLYYLEDSETKDTYCMFHIPKELKEKFTYHQNKLFKKLIPEYIQYCGDNSKVIDFSNAVFHIEFDIDINSIDFKKKKLDLDFTKVVFLKYFRMDNLKCNQLIFKDTEFHSGGGIKNRGGENQVNIQNLEFRPYRLDTDFVIDIGKYGNKEGSIESSTGAIKKIRFENHKIGNGVVYFIGLNKKLEEANFRNMILDNVSFQNCNLSKCYFLNAKVDETEFRNCEFNVNKDYMGNQRIKYASMLVLIASMYEIYDNGVSIHSFLFYIFSFLFLFTIAFNKHISIYDENKLSSNINENRETLKSVSETYRLLRSNFGKTDYQIAGDFFYSQRFIQLSLKSKKYDHIIYTLHYYINGFGENFLRPLIVFCLIIVSFMGFYVENKDFIATDNTPSFLLVKKDTNETLHNKNTNETLYYKYQKYLDENNTIQKRIYIPNKLLTCVDNNESKPLNQFINPCIGDRVLVKIVYSASQFISPFTSKNRAWFKTVDAKASWYNLIETILLYIFFGAFILAIKNRIKR